MFAQVDIPGFMFNFQRLHFNKNANRKKCMTERGPQLSDCNSAISLATENLSILFKTKFHLLALNKDLIKKMTCK